MNEQQERTAAASSSTQAASSSGRTTGDRERPVPVGSETERSRPGRRLGLTPLGDPFAVIHQLQSEMDRLFHDFGSGLGLRRLRGDRDSGIADMWNPQVDIFRRNDSIVVRADLPGVSREDVSVDLEEGVLTIRGERRHDAEEEREGYYWSERSFGSFERSIPLPEGVDESKAAATFKDGVLEVTMPAPKEQSPRKRRVEIR
jgi:HSP20 family protein